MDKIVIKVNSKNVLTFKHPMNKLKLPDFIGDTSTSLDNNDNYINFEVLKEN